MLNRIPKRTLPILFMLCLLGNTVPIFSQVSSKVTNERFDQYMDSIQKIDYPYVLPVFGDKVREMGYDLPKPAGLMLGFLTMSQDLNINDLSVARNADDELVDISELVAFSKISTNNNVYSFRPDLWVFPFMNVYGIFNYFDARTDVVLQEPFELQIPQVNNSGYGAGFGTSLAYGWGPVWASGNFNWAWSKTPLLVKPTQSFSTSLRVGTQLWNKKRTQHISVWIGANYLDYNGFNGGSYDLTNLLPEDIDLLEELQKKVGEITDGLNERYEDFCNRPGNGPKCAILNPILEEFKSRIEDKISGIEPPDLIINYGFRSEPRHNWNMVTGAQYTLKKRWDFRMEFGFINRRSFMFNVNYRFGIVKKKKDKVISQ